MVLVFKMRTQTGGRSDGSAVKGLAYNRKYERLQTGPGTGASQELSWLRSAGPTASLHSHGCQSADSRDPHNTSFQLPTGEGRISAGHVVKADLGGQLQIMSVEILIRTQTHAQVMW